MYIGASHFNYFKAGSEPKQNPEQMHYLATNLQIHTFQSCPTFQNVKISILGGITVRSEEVLVYSCYIQISSKLKCREPTESHKLKLNYG